MTKTKKKREKMGQVPWFSCYKLRRPYIPYGDIDIPSFPLFKVLIGTIPLFIYSICRSVIYIYHPLKIENTLNYWVMRSTILIRYGENSDSNTMYAIET